MMTNYNAYNAQDQAYLRGEAPVDTIQPVIQPSTQPTNTGYDYSRLKPIGQGLMQNAGNITSLIMASKLDKDKYDRVTPELLANPNLLDPSQALRDVKRNYVGMKDTVGSRSGGNTATYLANIQAANASKMNNELRIRKDYDNVNAGIKNQFLNKNTDINIKYKNDVVLDKIIEITKVDISKYPKVYDMTVSSTLNFCIANGLHVVDTAETGYIQKKMIKATEDNMIKYDGTVRNANNRVLQFIYGDSGIDTIKQFTYNIGMVKLDNDEIRNKFTLNDNELTSKFTKKDNNKLYDEIIKMRDDMRKFGNGYNQAIKDIINLIKDK